MVTRYILALILLQSLVTQGHANEPWIKPVAEDLLQGTPWHDAGTRHGVDPWLLYALTLEESNRFDSERGLLHPWQYVVHVGGQLTYYESRSDAEAAIEEIRAEGIDNFDAGPLQLNWLWHGEAFDSPEQLLSLEPSLDRAAFILAQNLSLSPSDKALAIGRYRTWQSEKAYCYARRIAEVRVQLPGGDAYQTMLRLCR